MPLHAEVCVAFALPITLPPGFNCRTLSAMMLKLSSYEPTPVELMQILNNLFEVGSGGFAVQKRRFGMSIFEMDADKEYPKIKYHDAVETYDFDGPLMKAFETAATKVLGDDHNVSVVLQERFGKEEDQPNYAMYLVHKPTMLTPGEDVKYDEIRIPCDYFSFGLDSTDIPIGQVDVVATKKKFERLCLALGMDAAGDAGWKLIASVGLQDPSWP